MPWFFWWQPPSWSNQGSVPPATSHLIHLQKILVTPERTRVLGTVCLPGTRDKDQIFVFIMSPPYNIKVSPSKKGLAQAHSSVLKPCKEKTDCFRRCWAEGGRQKRYSDMGQMATREGHHGGQPSLGRREWTRCVLFPLMTRTYDFLSVKLSPSTPTIVGQCFQRLNHLKAFSVSVWLVVPLKMARNLWPDVEVYQVSWSMG